jgi:hypothetical protein
MTVPALLISIDMTDVPIEEASVYTTSSSEILAREEMVS